jgi:hypothetical protein
MRSGLPFIAALFLLLPIIGFAQHGGRHGASGTNSGTTSQPEDPDAATFKRAVADQATDEQSGQFHLMITRTEAARQQAHNLQDLGTHGGKSEDLTAQVSALQDSVDRALTDTRIFLQSFSDAQAANLKNLAKKLTKSGAGVNKSAKGLPQPTEGKTIRVDQLVKTAAGLEKALVELQSDQLNLGKEMAVPTP